MSPRRISIPDNRAEEQRAAEAARAGLLARERTLTRNREGASLLEAEEEEEQMRPRGGRRGLLG